MYKLLTILIGILVFNSCNNNPVTPDPLQPGRRDYVWRVDTLYLPFNPFTDITGTAPNDVWVCSPGDAEKIFYHFDGQTWKNDQVWRTFSPLSISSVNKNAVWSCGFDGKIWYFNGNNWAEHYKFPTAVDTSIILQEMMTISNSDVYAVGQYYLGAADYWGLILFFDGNSWKKKLIPKTRVLFSGIQRSSNGRVYLLGLTQQAANESNYQFYEFKDNDLKEKYSGSQSTNEVNGRLLQLGQKTYFIIGYDFYSYNGSSFKKIGRLSDDPKFMNAGIGRNEKDIFLGMRDGIAHYNGENTVYLYQTFGNVFVRKGIVFEKDVFFLGRDVNGNNFIFHGTLKE